MPPGRVIAALNYEPLATGYRRLKGFERFDGRTAPSAGGVRANITAVPGSGSVLGVHHYAGFVLAVRNNSGGTAAVIHQAATTGWREFILTRTLAFTSGDNRLSAALNGGFLQGATSGASAILLRYEITSGSLSGGDAAGTLFLYSQTSTFVAENLNVLDGPLNNVATVAGDSSVTGTFPAGGAYKFLTHNFYGASNLTKIYGVNGVGKGFFLDWTTREVTFITTGMATDIPTRLAEHRESLFYAFTGGSVQFSTVGDPEDWSPITGAGELTVGNEIVDFATPPNALAILGETSIHILYGSDSSDYQLEELTDAAGALPHTAQEVGSVIYGDNRGLRSLSAAQRYGNFRMGTISRLIEPLWTKKRADGVDPSASLVCRTQDQYWLFFEDGTGLVVYMGGKEPSILPFNLGVTVTCATSAEVDGVERIFLGASNGFVYELNKGTSFDGAAIEHYCAMAYNYCGSPQQEKRIHKAIINAECSGTTTISVAARFNQGSEDGPDAQTVSLTTGGGAINDLGTGESYYQALSPAVGEAYMDGVFRDISIKVSGSQSTQEAHTLTDITLLVSGRGLKR